MGTCWRRWKRKSSDECVEPHRDKNDQLENDHVNTRASVDELTWNQPTLVNTDGNKPHVCVEK